MTLIEAYAVICENDCIADASGVMPAELKNEAEWTFFQNGLDTADVIVLGRKSHEITPNPKGRRRLVLSSRVERAQWESAQTVIWNPAGAALTLALDMFDVAVSRLAITGGQGVFDFFLQRAPGYTQFHLSRLKDVYLKEGRKVFSDLEMGGRTPESLLEAAGYVPGAFRELDNQASVVSWRQDP